MTDTQTHGHRKSGIEFLCIMVSDGAMDTSWKVIVYYIQLKRNVGFFYVAEQEVSLLYTDKQGGRVIIYNQLTR